MASRPKDNTSSLVAPTVLLGFNSTPTTQYITERDIFTTQDIPDPDIFNLNKIQGVLICMYAVVIVIGVTGNGLLVFTIIKSKRLHTVTNYFIASLAFSDFIVCITCMPFTLMHRLQAPYWPFGHFMCHFVTTIQLVSVYVSTWTLTAIAIDRYVLICHPMRSRMSSSKCFITITFIWIIAIIFALPTGVHTNQYDLTEIKPNYIICLELWPDLHFQLVYNIATFAVQYLFPVYLIIMLYLRIGLALKNRISPGARTMEQEIQQHRLKRKSHLLMSLVVFVFALCWLPIYLIRFIDDLDFLRFGQRVTIGVKYYDLLFTLSHWFAMTSVCYNPFLYAWYHENFLRMLKRIITCQKAEFNTVAQVIQYNVNGQSSIGKG